ncbi:MAG: flavodoxin domain-containing protein [Candidatus Bathyarchaeota archaeon]|nr:flavodoxin domain-containing protein [Candidatus Bathyarchaeota archaeon]
MKTCILYFSRTGNTKRMAQAISDAAKAPAFDINSTSPEIVDDYALLMIGTPVEGFRPAKETLAFVQSLPKTEGKKVILFCTYALWKGSTFKVLEKELSRKGYSVTLSVSKKGIRPGKAVDFSDILDKIGKAIV